LKSRTSFVSLAVIMVAVASLGLGCGGPKKLATMTAGDLFAEGKKLYEKHKYLRAIEIFQSCIYNYPGESIVDTAQYYLALSYFGNREYEVAQVEFNRLVLNYPSSVYFEQSVFMRAVCFFEATPKHHRLDQSELETAIRQFEDFIIDFPESEAVEDARKYLLVARTRLARKYYDAGVVYSRIRAYEAAQIYYQKVIDDFTDTEFAAPAAFEHALAEFKMRRYDQARQRFKDFQSLFADHEKAKKARELEIEAAFKLGETAFRKGDYELAQEKLEAFKADYPQHHLNGKADKYLKKMTEAEAGSENDDEDS